jgi:RNA polymerase sigma-70 factor, ECF subfamily
MMTDTVDEASVVAAMRAGDDAVFAQLVDQHTPSMLRIARGYVSSQEIAEEVVQERGLPSSRGSPSLRAGRLCAHGFSP